MNIKELIENSIPATQGRYIYSNPDDQRWRYNPRRIQNRKYVENLFSSKTPTKFPVHIIVEVTNICNLDCLFCNRIVMSRPVKSMPLEVFKKIVDQATEQGIYSMSLYMLGEPFLHKNIREIVNYGKKMGIPYMDISTNGHYDMRSILGTSLNELIISIDGNKKETFESLRKGSNWELVIKNVEEFLEAKKKGNYEYPFVRMQIIDLKQTHDEIPGFVERWIHKVDVIYIKKFEEMRQSFNEEHSKSLRIIESEEDNRMPCKQLFFTQNINSNGDISLCCHDPHGYLVVGNIDKESIGTLPDGTIYQIPRMTLQEAWDSAKIVYFRNQHTNGKYPSICNPCKDWQW